MSTAPAPANSSEHASSEGHAFRSGRHAARAATGAQAQLDNLARAGVVTHVVGHGEAIDPLFAVGQLRDLPEVRFVAAFREGVIALGCPDGLPDQLVDLAAPISVSTAPPDEEPEKQDDIQPVLDAILERLTALEGPSGLGAVQEQLSTLDTVGLETARLVGDLAHHAAEVPRDTGQIDMNAALDAPLSALRSDQSVWVEQISTALTDVSDRLRTVEGQIDAACESASVETPQPTSDADELTALLNGLPDLNEGLGRLETTLTAAVQKGHVRLDEVLNKLTQTANDASTQNQSSALASIQTTLDDVSARLETGNSDPHAADIAEALAALQDSNAERTAILAALAQLHESVEGLTARPDPVLDLTAQRQSFAQFGTVMKMVVERMEGTAAQIRDSLQAVDAQAQSAPEEFAAQLDNLPMVLLEHLRGSPEAVLLMSELAAIKAQLEFLPNTQAQVESANATLEILANRPKPVLDLSEQRRSFAAFTTALATVVQRLETSAERFGDIPATGSGETPLHDLIAHLPEQLASQIPPALDVSAVAQELAQALPAPPDVAQVLAELKALQQQMSAPSQSAEVDLGPLEAQISQLITDQAKIPSTLVAVEKQVSALNETPAPVLDMTEQRASFAMFSTALATVVARLESAAGQFGSVASEDAELSSLLRNMHDLVASLGTDHAGLEERLAPLSALPSLLAQMQSSLEDRIASQNAPALDLTAQRQSLARFATAIQTVIERLETVAEALPEQVDARENAQSRPLLKRMRRLERQIAAMRTTQEDATADFTRFIEVLAAEDKGDGEDAVKTADEGDFGNTGDLPSEPAPTPIDTAQEAFEGFETAAAPLDSLRFCFAEMIASQIKQTAKDSNTAID